MDLADILFRVALLVLLLGLLVAICWPLNQVDVMQEAHGDQPRLEQ